MSNTSANANLVARFLTAVVAIPVLLGVFYKGPAIATFVVVLIAVGAAGRELFRMTHPDDRVSQVIGIVLGLAVCCIVYFLGHDARYLLGIVLGLPIIALFVVLWRLGEMSSAAMRVAALGFGPLYVSLLSSVALLRRDRGDDGPSYVVLVLAISWVADTFGYFAGRFLGKHKLYEAVSPKKTIEGAIGGLFGSVLSVVIIQHFLITSLDLTHGVILALVAGALGQLGDLGESLLKRSIGVKDSGGLVPGHGGILDRVDATVVASVIIYLYTRFQYG
ncbi:MAG: phosphatidate cytidylyltransferase [Polyangiaceae bacterium]